LRVPTGQTLLVTALIVLGVVLAIAAVVTVAIVVLVRRARDRRRLRREEEARRLREQESADRFGSGVVALSATLEGVRFATQVARAGAEVGRQGLAPVLAGSLRLLADYAESERLPNLRRLVADDGTVTLMFSDIQDSTTINEELGDEAWLRLLREHDDILRRAIRRSGGRVVKTQGDSFMVAFKSLLPAVECAIASQRALAGAGLGDARPIQVRMGLHHGEVTRQGRDVFGLNVAMAARVAAEARGGEVLVTQEVKRLVGKDADVRFGRGRTVQLKGISKAATVYPVLWQAG
jgi:adenylate cyclase